MDKKISYLNRTYADYKEALIEMSERYYPDLSTSFNDASIASWFLDITADVADNLSYHIDRAYQETQLNSAQELNTLYTIARNNGVKIPGPKSSVAEISLTINAPITAATLPIIKAGSKFGASSQQFELLSDVDFNSYFNEDGLPDKTIRPSYDSNGRQTGNTITKLALVNGGETRVYRFKVNSYDIKPFMEVLLPIENITNIESIIMKEGDINTFPTYSEFYGKCDNAVTRFYEVDNLAEGYVWAEAESTPSFKSESHVITKGEWKNIEYKFITEYTDKGYLKIIFGSGTGYNAELDNVSNFNKWQMSRILNNNNLGLLPNPNTTLFILYRVGGGKNSNVGKGAINKIVKLNYENGDSGIINTLKVENTTPSFSGKDMPSPEEMKYIIKYHKASQERCVTVKDYIDRLLMLPPKYGTPFRVGVAEENNKIGIYVIGINNKGKLNTSLPTLLANNIVNYLSGYKMINDFVEVKPGRIINIGFDVELFIDKSYNYNDVVKNVIETIKSYMDINKHIMGEDIYIGDILKEIGKVDGVINVISLKVYNKFGLASNNREYSYSKVNQEVESVDDNSDLLNLEACDWVLYNDGDCMAEIKFPEDDIKVSFKLR